LYSKLEDEGDDGDISSDASDVDLVDIPGTLKGGGVALPEPKTPTRQQSLLDIDIESPFKRAERYNPNLRLHQSSNWRSAPKAQSPTADSHAPAVIGKYTPEYDSTFWEIYGNKLRVYGTETEVCDLSA